MGKGFEFIGKMKEDMKTIENVKREKMIDEILDLGCYVKVEHGKELMDKARERVSKLTNEQLEKQRELMIETMTKEARWNELIERLENKIEKVPELKGVIEKLIELNVNDSVKIQIEITEQDFSKCENRTYEKIIQKK